VTGIESSEILAGHARKNLSIKVETVHGWDLSGLPEEQFDAAYTHSFEHFSDPRGMLRQIRRALKPGGTLMIEVPYQFHSLKDLVRIRLARALGKHRYRVFRKAPPFTFHLYFFDPKTLGRLLAEEGFDLVALRTYLPSHPVFARNPRGRWVQEGLYALGGLFKRGPSLETISRAAANDSAYGLNGQDGCTGPSRTAKSQRRAISR
jgi:SAM-dependent methyltransferase